MNNPSRSLNKGSCFYPAQLTGPFMEVNIVKKSNIERQLTLFLGYIKRNGATEKELQTVVDTIGLLRKYLPFYKKQKES